MSRHVETCLSTCLVNFFPKQVLPVMGSLLHLTSGPGGVGLLGSSVFLFHGSGCLELSLPAALAAFGCIWLSGVAMVAWIAFFLSAAYWPCWVLWPACVGMLFLLLSRAVHGSWVHVLKLAGFTYEAHEGFWWLRNGGMDGSPVALLSIQLCWFAGAARFAASFYVFGSPCSIQLFRVAGAVSFSCLGGLRWKQNGTCH